VHPRTTNPRAERDACGIGFLADATGRASRAIVDGLLEGLAGVRHRGAVAADGVSGDGAGLLLPIPRALVPAPWCGLAQVFVRDATARAAIEEACEGEGIEPAGWREVPVDPAALGDAARRSMPRIEQLVLRRPLGTTPDEAELCARVERGVYVTRFWYTNVVRPKETLVTAVTRDGTFLIEDGEVTRPLDELRLTDTLLGILDRTEALGARQALWSEGELYGRRFATGVVAPPLRSTATFTGAAEPRGAN